MKSVSESTGLGKIIIDKRPRKQFINEDALVDIYSNGIVNGCSPYESLMILIPSKGYTSKTKSSGFRVDEKDRIIETEETKNRKLNELEVFTRNDIFPWHGISEDKGKLSVPNQNECRIIHYESCRGLESWTVACMSLDEYFDYKKNSEEAKNHLSDDLFLSEDERSNKYAALWCLMAFTRPIDTLYIHLENPTSEFSKKLLEICEFSEGVTIKN